MTNLLRIMEAQNHTIRYQYRAKRDLTGPYDVIVYKAGELFYPWDSGKGSPLFTEDDYQAALKRGYVENNCGHGCTFTLKFPDDFDIERVSVTMSVDVERV